MQYWHPLQVSQDKSFIQKKHDDLQNYNKCSRDSSSALQKAHKGDSTILKRWTFQFISEIIRLKILYWNSLRLVSNVVSKLKGNNFFQSLLSLGAVYTNTLNQIDFITLSDGFIIHLNLRPHFSLLVSCYLLMRGKETLWDVGSLWYESECA